MVVAYLGIGSNLGNREKNIKQAVKKLKDTKEIKVIKVSSLIETEAVGGPAQGKFLNGAVAVKTTLSPLKLLKELKNIEKFLGRKKTVRFGPRIIDLDILLYGDRRVRQKNLVIPHLRMFKRDFVLAPLNEIAPSLLKKLLERSGYK